MKTDRRAFFELCAKAMPAGVTLLAVSQGETDAQASGAPTPSAPERSLPNYAMAVDVEKCIGCGRCAAACKAENKVPDSPHYVRTWVERYVVPTQGETMVDSPNAGIDGFPDQPPIDTLKTFFVPSKCSGRSTASPC